MREGSGTCDWVAVHNLGRLASSEERRAAALQERVSAAQRLGEERVRAAQNRVAAAPKPDAEQLASSLDAAEARRQAAIEYVGRACLVGCGTVYRLVNVLVDVRVRCQYWGFCLACPCILVSSCCATHHFLVLVKPPPPPTTAPPHATCPPHIILAANARVPRPSTTRPRTLHGPGQSS